MCWTSSFFMLLGRFLLAAIFLLSAYGKVVHYDATAAYMASKGLPIVPLLLGLSIVIEFVGGLSLIFGYKIRALATLLILYLIPVTVIMHDFWMMDDPIVSQDNMFHFFKNLAIIGGLLYVVSVGAGYIGFDRCSSSCRIDKDLEIK